MKEVVVLFGVYCLILYCVFECSEEVMFIEVRWCGVFCEDVLIEVDVLVVVENEC